MVMVKEKSEFERAINKYSDAVFRCAYTYCGSRSDAEDIVQEVFIKYLKKAPEFNDDEHEKAWLLKVAVNLSKDLVKSYWHKNRSDLSDEMKEESYVIDESEYDIWKEVSALPPKYRIVIELYYHEGYSIAEISQIIGKAESTVGNRLARAKKLLKESMEED